MPPLLLYNLFMKKRLISGITATGNLTIGNYIGAIKNFIKLQDQYEMFIFVADLHALTIDIEPKTLSENRKNIMALYVAAGLDPQKTTLFYQSKVRAHGMMSWFMENRTTLGELSRMTQFKDKGGATESNGTTKIKTGLLTYPALMAGDILLYNASIVPVGADQKQHLELTRNIAQRFNNQYGETFIIPEPFIPELGARICSLTEPTKKMSKSDKNAKSTIYLLDNPEEAYKKIQKAVTDSEGKIYVSPDKPGVTNLLTIYASFKEMTLVEVENHFKDKNYGELKQEVGEVVKSFLTDLQAKFAEALSRIDEIAIKGSRQAEEVANATLANVEKKLGL